ncbi:hypothetical protein T02_7542 [Trichinella nativa]|uniref:Uncharacterized protein n=1 Tax=Trichinella nativa TaxID=6335 RepID=A0A0V1KPN3_9BILA|nr:hypothetical protein T02_7542 [Trichinella nativa]
MAMKNEISKYKKYYECRTMKISKIFNPRLIWKSELKNLELKESVREMLQKHYVLSRTTRPDQLFHSSLFNSDSEYEANAVLHGDAVDSYFNAAEEPTNTES